MSETVLQDLRRTTARLSHHLDTERAEELRTFREAVETLSGSVLGTFRREEWPGYCQMDKVFTQGYGLPVPSLSICGKGTAEIRYTQLLAWFLDSGNPHGLGGKLAEAVFRPAFGPEDGQLPSFDTVRATAEVALPETQINGRRSGNSLDILLEGAGDWILCVEQKVGSAEGDQQLSRYNDALGRMYPGRSLKCFYLTPDGKAGSKENWIPISHLELIQRMASVLEFDVLYPAARFNLKALLWDLLLGPLARDSRWMEKFRGHVRRVALNPDQHFPTFSSWLERYHINENARRTLLRLVEV